MKADIDAKGCLSVTPESQLEQFALRRWSDDYFQNCDCKGNGFATLMVCRIEIKDETRRRHD